MMALLGTIVNCVFIIIGSLIGRLLANIPESMKSTVMKGIGLTVTVLGIQMGMKSSNFLYVIISIVLGAVLGEALHLEEKLNKLGVWIEKKVGRNLKGNVAQGFVTATLIFVIGAMAVVGALDSGIRGDHQVLYTKAMLDGFTAIMLTSTLGLGVMFSSIPVFLYQGIIALFANQINQLIPKQLMDGFILELTATGGIIILAIGLNILEITKIKVANLLPGLLVIAIIVPIVYCF